jgi:hypothetical protein
MRQPAGTSFATGWIGYGTRGNRSQTGCIKYPLVVRSVDQRVFCKLLIFINGRGEKIRTSDPWSPTNNRFTNLLSRLGLFSVLHHVSSRYSAANGPNLDPSIYLPLRRAR